MVFETLTLLILTPDSKQCYRCMFRPRVNDFHDELEKLVLCDLAINVFHDGTWGSFVHLPIDRGKFLDKFSPTM